MSRAAFLCHSRKESNLDGCLGDAHYGHKGEETISTDLLLTFQPNKCYNCDHRQVTEFHCDPVPSFQNQGYCAYHKAVWSKRFCIPQCLACAWHKLITWCLTLPSLDFTRHHVVSWIIFSWNWHGESLFLIQNSDQEKANKVPTSDSKDFLCYICSKTLDCAHSIAEEAFVYFSINKGLHVSDVRQTPGS